jgi:hypothetical protein
LEKQRRLNREAEESHQKKMIEVANSDVVHMSERYNELHLSSALEKLTEAATRYDSVRGVSLISFEPAHLSPLEFQKGLKRTFNIRLSAQEVYKIKPTPYVLYYHLNPNLYCIII